LPPRSVDVDAAPAFPAQTPHLPSSSTQKAMPRCAGMRGPSRPPPTTPPPTPVDTNIIKPDDGQTTDQPRRGAVAPVALARSRRTAITSCPVFATAPPGRGGPTSSGYQHNEAAAPEHTRLPEVTSTPRDSPRRGKAERNMKETMVEARPA